MKEFMFIFKGPYYEDMNMSANDAQNRMQQWFAWMEKLKSEDVYVSGKPLVRNPGKTVSGANKVVTDGPFAESKELVGGYFIIKANNIDEAVAAAKDFPDYDLGGSVDVREVQVIHMP